jgi:hypothetical protein
MDCECTKNFRGVGGFSNVPPCDNSNCFFKDQIAEASFKPSNPPHGIQISIDKEWVKRLLREFDMYFEGRTLHNDELEYFLDKSEVWNGK